MLHRCYLPLALGCVVIGQSAIAADNPPLDVIIVTPVPGQGIARDLLPGNVQTADSDAIDRSHATDATAFLARYLGSVHLNETQNNPFQPDVNFRGFTASPLLGAAQGLSVYLDGVRLNQPFGDVLSWDLIPRRAIDTMTLMPGSNPLFGLNTLGGALNVTTKSGATDPGTMVEVIGGEYGRRSGDFEHGGSRDGWHWYVTGNHFHDDGWRAVSASDVRQLFGKIGHDGDDGSFALSAAVADNKLRGNGLQEHQLLAADRTSVYTRPDITDNDGMLFNLTGSRRLARGWQLSGNAWWRRIVTDTYNGDLNDGSLDQAVYQPGAAERAALTAAGYSGFPVSGESAINTPFPKWRCIAQVLLNDEPGEKCNGVINRSGTRQHNEGFNLQLAFNQLVFGTTLDRSGVRFHQSAELGYLDASRAIVGTGAFADGIHAGTVDGEPLDSRVDLDADTLTWSLFVADTLVVSADTHVSLSGRYNHVAVDNRDGIHPGGGTGSLDGDHTFSRFNPALGLTHRFAEGFTGYASISQGSRAPSAVELGCADPASPCKLPNAMAGDPPLKQVVATTMEAGLRGKRGSLQWNLGVYRTDSRDDILFVADSAAGFGYFRNFGATRRQGFEAGVSTQLGNAQVGANYSVIDATYRSAELLNGGSNSSNDQARAGFPGVDGGIAIAPGNQLPLIPRQLLKLFADVQVLSSLTLNADITVVGGSFARGNENNAHQPDGRYYLGTGRSGGYAVMNLGAEWQVVPHFDLFAQVDNLFDRGYDTAAQLSPFGLTAAGNYLARPFAANAAGERPLTHSTFYAPGAPRTAWLGLRYRFGG